MKRLITINVSLYLIAFLFLFYVFNNSLQSKIKNTEVNDIIFTIKKYWPDVEKALNVVPKYDIDYIIVDEHGEKIFSSKLDIKTDYVYNYIHKDYSIDIINNGKTEGKIIFINSENDEFNKNIKKFLFLLFIFLFIKDLSLIFYLKKNIFIPVKKINNFARDISKGNLDIMVNKIDNNSFGILFETFNIMKEELIYSKKREQEADKSRRELIVNISHDIKNPIASIQSIAEFQLLTNDIEEIRNEFQVIFDKTNQIGEMVSNLHTSALTDLEKLTINLEIVESSILEKALLQSDFKKKIKDIIIPECLIVVDKVRIFQIMDNIISNSYKYADTLIEIKAYFKEKYLCICIKDFGIGVKKEEEIFLTQKYYRAENAKDKEGSGLGMYIVKYILDKMNGKVEILSNENEYFEVKLYFLLAI